MLYLGRPILLVFRKGISYLNRQICVFENFFEDLTFYILIFLFSLKETKKPGFTFKKSNKSEFFLLKKERTKEKWWGEPTVPPHPPPFSFLSTICFHFLEKSGAKSDVSSAKPRLILRLVFASSHIAALLAFGQSERHNSNFFPKKLSKKLKIRMINHPHLSFFVQLFWKKVGVLTGFLRHFCI